MKNKNKKIKYIIPCSGGIDEYEHKIHCGCQDMIGHYITEEEYEKLPQDIKERVIRLELSELEEKLLKYFIYDLHDSISNPTDYMSRDDFYITNVSYNNMTNTYTSIIITKYDQKFIVFSNVDTEDIIIEEYNEDKYDLTAKILEIKEIEI